MKQIIFIFALLLSTVAAFAQNANKISPIDYDARKKALVEKYGADYEKHVDELNAPVASEKAAAPAASDRAALSSPTGDKANAQLITKDFLYKTVGDSYEKYADFIGKPIAFMRIMKGEKVKISVVDYKTTDDATRQFIDNHKEFIVIVE